MRLIDADAMLERLEEWNTKDKIDKALYNFAWLRVMEQPTAYDIERVCEEPDRAKYPFNLFDVGGWCSVDESILKADMVESIVRRGGIDG